MARVTVEEVELRTALIALKKEKPTLGVVKIHALLLEAYPTWAVSEKRVRKVLQSEGLVATNKDNGSGPPIATYPVSRLNKTLDVTRWSSKVKVHYFNAIKGKGLVAAEKISEGEVLWKEDPFILAPEWCVFSRWDSCWPRDSCSSAGRAGIFTICKSPPGHVHSAQPLWGTTRRSICHARRPCPRHHAQPCSAIAFVVHNRRKCIHFSVPPVIQRRSLSSSLHAIPSGWPSTRSRSAPADYYYLPREMTAHWTKTFKSCRALLSSEWKSVSEHFGV